MISYKKAFGFDIPIPTHLFVKRFQFLIILLRGVHLNFESVYLEELRSLFEIFLAVVCLTREPQLLEDLGQFVKLVSVVVKFAEFCVGLEPESVVFRVSQRLQRRLVKVLQEFHIFRGGDVIENGVDRLFGIVSRHGAFDIAQQLTVPRHHLLDVPQLKVYLDHLLERLESPFALFFL